MRMDCLAPSACVVLAGFAGAPRMARAQPAVEEAASPGKGAVEGPELPDYGGGWLSRSYLSGDWGGARSRLAAGGLTLDMSWTQVVQGVVSGGQRRDWDYGGNVNALLGADLERMGLSLGGTISLRAESRYGETVNDDAGAFTPVNTRGFFPLSGSINEGIPLAITELTYAHALGETVELTVGKMLTVEGDPVEFAGGLGRTQFLNADFIYNATTSQTAPYSALGAMVDWTPAEWVTVSMAVFETTDVSTTTGFDHLSDGWTWWGQAATQYWLRGLPGGMNVGFLYAFGNEFAKLGGTLVVPPGGGLAPQTVSDSWAVFWGAWQYLYSPDPPPEGGVDAGDERADMRGLGVFARLGYSDPAANPVAWSGSIGVGARGVLPGRDGDTLGVGYCYTDVRDAAVFAALGLASNGQSFEAFYNIAVTPAVGLTVDVQWVDGGLAGTSPATVVGLRLDVNF